MNNVNSILVVEDELLIANFIVNNLREYGIENVHNVSSVEKAIDYIQKNDVNLVFLDINLNRTLDGIHLSSILKTEYLIPFIFVTSYSDSVTLSRIVKTKPADLLIKPITEVDIVKCLDRFHQSQVFESTPAFKTLTVSETKSEEETLPKHLFVKNGKRIKKIKMDEIHHMESEGRYVYIHFGVHREITNLSLKKLIEQLPKQTFIQVHKSYAVNINHIESIESSNVHLTGFSSKSITIPLGRAFRSALMKLIGEKLV